MFRPSLRQKRHGVAAVEFAFVMTFILTPMMIGIWQVGRLIQVQQIVSNSAREGARLAAQGRTINVTGAPTQIEVSIAPPAAVPNVKAAVYQTLLGAGLTNLTWDDVQVQFKWLDPIIPFTPPGSTVARDPGAQAVYEGQKNQRFEVKVTIPYEKVRWINVDGNLISPSVVTFTVQWRMMVDDPFEIDDAMPAW